MKKQVKIQQSFCLNLSRFENGGSVVDFIANLEGVVDAIKLNVEAKGLNIDECQVQICEHSENYNYYSEDFNVESFREETDEEYSCRIKQEKKKEETDRLKREMYQKQEYLRLKAIFEPEEK